MTVKLLEMVVEEKVEDSTQRRGRFLRLGPTLVLLNFAQGLTAVVLTDLIVERTCLVSLNINSTECSVLRENSDTPAVVDLEAKVERYASMIVMTNTLMGDILPAIITLFSGPWSDRGGRKPLLLAVLSGFSLQFLMLSLMCNWNISPWYLVFAMIPANIVGGTAAVKLVSICYIAETTKEEDRMLQYALLQISYLGGNMLGRLTTPLIYRNYGYTYIFGTATICYGLALAFAYIYTPETVKDASKVSIRELFKISFVREFVHSTFITRGILQRSIVWLAISTLALTMVTYRGEETTEFLFTRARLSWDVKDYSYYSTTDFLIRLAGLCGVLLRNLIPGVTDTFVAGLGLVSALGAVATKSLAWQSWHMYLAVCIGTFSQMIASSMRSIISKFVPATDVGKVFSLVALLEILCSIVGSPLYALIYSHYIPPIYPSPIYLLSSSFYILLLVFVTCMAILIGKSRELQTYVATAQEDYTNDDSNELQL